ncbi:MULTISPECIES: hypothetical protein [unclassified Microbacterium]|nr:MULTISPECIES: hypothetical protein [unclassified Microbacterium]|tara:strand:- start:1004 stop:1126 length:123 start_codon:yes stop_codon:yes gene_type:complete
MSVEVPKSYTVFRILMGSLVLLIGGGVAFALVTVVTGLIG